MLNSPNRYRYWPVVVMLGVATTLLGEVRSSEHELRRWAVVASPDVAQGGLPDLITVSLSKSSSLELVERQELAAATRELELSKYSGAGAGQQRLRLGQLLKADALLLMSFVATGDKSSERVVELVIAECRSGTRLAVDYLPYDKQQLDKLAGRCAQKVNDTRQRFSAGVVRTIGVTQFLSKNFVHDYDHLQSGYAGLLASALTSFPGVAVIEIEEARAIAAELKQSGDELAQRVVPTIVSGEFKVSKPTADNQEPTIHVVVTLSRQGKVVRRGVIEDRPLNEVPKLLRLQFAPAIVRRSSTADGLKFSVDEQYRHLTERAGDFARVGAFHQSTALREAALLLKSDDLAQKLLLISEYRGEMQADSQGIYSKIDANPYAKSPPGSQEYRDQLHQKHMRILRIMARHIEDEIRRCRINAREANQLVFEFMGLANVAGNMRYGEKNAEKAEQLLETFAWRVLPLFHKLPTDLRDGGVHPVLRDRGTLPGTAWTAERQRDRWTSTGLSMVTFLLPGIKNRGKYPGNYQYALDGYERFLTEVPTGPLPIPHMAQKTMQFMIKGTPDQLRDFYERLKKSKQSWNELYGRCGLLSGAIVRHRYPDDSSPLRKELNELRAMVVAGTTGKKDGASAADPFLMEFRRLEKLIEQREKPPAGKTPQPDKVTAQSKTPPTVRFVKLDGRRCAWESIERCSNDLDLCWSTSEVAFVPAPGRTVVVYRGQSPDEHVAYAKWDGQFVWVVTMANGVRVFDTAGRQVAYFRQRRPDASAGDQPAKQSDAGPAGVALAELPPYDRIAKLHRTTAPWLRLHPIGPGRSIIIGRYGQLHRLWFAVAQATKSKENKCTASAKVFHTCTKIRSNPDTPDDDPEQIFSALWMTELKERESGRRLLILARNQDVGDVRIGRRPLAIDLESLKVSVYPARFSSANFLPRSSFDGRIIQIGSKTTIFIPKPDSSEWDTQTISTGGQFKMSQAAIEHRGIIYVPGTRWLRIDRATWKVERLTAEPLPTAFQFCNFGVSAHHGLVAWAPGRALHKVILHHHEHDATPE